MDREGEAGEEEETFPFLFGSRFCQGHRSNTTPPLQQKLLPEAAIEARWF